MNLAWFGVAWARTGNPVGTLTTLAHTESTRPAHPRAHLSAYLIGAGATAAMIAGVLVAFLSMTTFLAFNGLPFGGFSDDSGAAYLDSSAGPSAAPRSAAIPLGAAHAAVTKDPVRGSHAGRLGSTGADSSGAANAGADRFGARGTGGHRSGGGASGGGGPGGGSAGGGPGGAATGGGSAGGGAATGGGPAGGGSSAPGGPAITPPDVPSVPTPAPGPGPVTNAVQDVDRVAGTDLSGPTSGATEAVDGAATGTVNQVGGAVGRPGMGDQVGGAVSDATDRVLGGGGGGAVPGGGSGGLLGG
jgi:hypothetical protein